VWGIEGDFDREGSTAGGAIIAETAALLLFDIG
jgi:hypothetical protein